jgi:hypothetical protein
MPSTALTLDEFFEGQAEARRVFEAVRTLIEALGPVAVQVTKSQVAFRRRKAFAWAWRPEQYLRRRAAPLVLSVALRRRDASARWKQIVEPARGRFMHHLELYTLADVDEAVRGWVSEAWEQAA